MEIVPAGRIGNLPDEPTSFVGRRREVADLRRLLARFRLVTVSGVGGVGKTRLALRVAERLRAGTRHGAWFVDLSAVRDPKHAAEVTDPEPVARVVADALAVPEASARPPVQSLITYLARRRMLLVLDSCEGVLPGCAILVETLLVACPGLRILATSRELLGVPAEARFVVEPLPVPNLAKLPTAPEDLIAYASVALFVARARAVVPGFQLTDANRQPVVGICHRLDGIPLAIELAAARLGTLTPHQTLDQLADRLTPLGPGPSASDRHRTLRACFDWSFDLCTDHERRLWARLSVFAGGFDVDAAEGICADDELPEDDVLDLLIALIGKSILVVEYRRDRARYRMLDTIRDYGRAQLGDAREEARVRRRHRAWYEQLVTRARADFISSRQPYWLDRLGLEYANLRAAVEYSLAEAGGAEAVLRMAVTVPWAYWVTRGLFGEVRRWVDEALARTIPTTALHARALLLAGSLAAWEGEFDIATRHVDAGEDLARSLDDPVGLAFADHIRGMAVAMYDDLPTALDLQKRALTRLLALPQPDLELQLRIMLALGVNAALSGDRGGAETHYRQILAITEPRGGSYYRSYALWALGIEAFRQGRLDEADTDVTTSLRIKRENLPGDRYGMALCLEAMAWIAAARHRHRHAAVLLGAADATWTEMGITVDAHRNLTAGHDDCEQQVRSALGGEAYASALRHGSELHLADAVTYALDGP